MALLGAMDRGLIMPIKPIYVSGKKSCSCMIVCLVATQSESR